MMRLTTILAGLWIALGTSVAPAQEAGPSPQQSAAVQGQVERWLDQAALFRTGAQEMARLWSNGGALLGQRTDIFIAEAEVFADFTEDYAHQIQSQPSGGDAARVLHGISRDVKDRLDALDHARGQGAPDVVRVLNGIDRTIHEGFVSLGSPRDLRADASPAIRTSYRTD